MYGRVTKYFIDTGYGFICGEDNNSYFVHHSQLKDEHIERGYYVFFKPYKSDRSDFNAGNISVIEAPDKQLNSTDNKNKTQNYISSKHKSCNADKIVRPDKQFKKFVKKFMEEKEKENVSK